MSIKQLSDDYWYCAKRCDEALDYFYTNRNAKAKEEALKWLNACRNLRDKIEGIKQ